MGGDQLVIATLSAETANQHYLAGNYEAALTLIHYKWKVKDIVLIVLILFLPGGG